MEKRKQAKKAKDKARRILHYVPSGVIPLDDWERATETGDYSLITACGTYSERSALTAVPHRVSCKNCKRSFAYRHREEITRALRLRAGPLYRAQQKGELSLDTVREHYRKEQASAHRHKKTKDKEEK